jgi:autotransporter-associated beta strand protein
VQSWGNLTLNNGLKVVVGGDVTFAGFAGAATTSIVGATQTGGAVSKLTFNVVSTTTIGSTITLGGAGAGENNLSLVKSGASSLTLSGTGTYTGATRVEAGTLRLGAANRIADTSTLVLAGGTFDVNGFSETLGALDLDATGFLDLDDAANVTGSISFANSSGSDWGSFGLSITASALGAQGIRFGTDAFSLNAGQLANITVNGQGGWTLDTQGYLTAIPEPSSFAVLAGSAALGAVALRRRRRA